MRIAVVTASRADYGIYYPLLKAIQAAGMELMTWPQGTHLTGERGYGIGEIEADFPGARRLESLDWVVVLGDTMPMLYIAIACAGMGIPLAHIHGGDRTGSIDDSIRHAITRFAQLHFPALPEHAERLRQMGEEDWRITAVGPLGMYAMDMHLKSKSKIALGLDESRRWAIVLQHPVHQERDSGKQMQATLEAVRAVDVQPIVLWPNDEPGSEQMVEVIEGSGFLHFKHLPYELFISLLSHADVIVGNSSCALVEAPHFGVSAVNIGTRQGARMQPDNVWNVSYVASDIEQAIQYALRATRVKATAPGWWKEGPERIIDRLRHETVDVRLMTKRITY